MRHFKRERLQWTPQRALKINDQNAIISLYNFLSYIPIHHLCNISRNLSEYLRYTWYGSAIRKVFRLDRRARACGSNRNQSTFGSADKITCPFQRLNLAKKKAAPATGGNRADGNLIFHSSCLTIVKLHSYVNLTGRPCPTAALVRAKFK